MGKIYVIQVMTGMEGNVARLIEGYNHPKIKRTHLLKDSYEVPLFPGYLFVEMRLDGDTYRPVLDTPFVIQYLCPVSGVRPITGLESESVNEYKCTPLLNGIPVEIIGGSLRGLKGIVASVKFPSILVDIDIYGEIVTFKVNIKNINVPGLLNGLGNKGGDDICLKESQTY